MLPWVVLMLGLAGGGLYRTAANLTPPAAPLPHGALYRVDATSIFSDFDGDGQPDRAISRPEGSHFKVEIQLTTRPDRVSFTVPGSERGIDLIAWDVDGDLDPDLMIVSAGTLQPLGVWLNDGHGHFEEGSGQRNSTALWGDGRSGYNRSGGRADLAFIHPSGRWFFEGPAPSGTALDLQPDGAVTGTFQEPSLQILAANLSSRSPPIFRTL